MSGEFIRHSFDAVDRLHHARTGALLPTKNVARNCKLIFVDETLVLLRHYETVVATFTPNGCVLDTNGWYTRETWERLNDLTPARCHRTNGLRFVSTGWGWDTLYVPGLKVTSEGETVNPMPRPLVNGIVHRVNNFRPKCRRYAKRLVREWDRFTNLELNAEGCEGCNRGSWSDELFARHMVEHIERGELVLNRHVRQSIAGTQNGHPHLHGDDLCELVAKNLAGHLTQYVYPEAVRMSAPDGFQYPQERMVAA